MAIEAQKKRGFLLVVSSPSGAGKTSLTRALLKEHPSFRLSISVTTRPPRIGERDGIDYHFVSAERMKELLNQKAFLEHAEVFRHSYGTLKEPVMTAIETGHVIICDIDWQGARSLRQSLKFDQVSVFILPPSIEELEHRLHGRAQDKASVLKERLAAAASDMSHWKNYDYVLVNDDFNRTLSFLQSIAQAESVKKDRCQFYLKTHFS